MLTRLSSSKAGGLEAHGRRHLTRELDESLGDLPCVRDEDDADQGRLRRRALVPRSPPRPRPRAGTPSTGRRGPGARPSAPPVPRATLARHERVRSRRRPPPRHPPPHGASRPRSHHHRRPRAPRPPPASTSTIVLSPDSPSRGPRCHRAPPPAVRPRPPRRSRSPPPTRPRLRYAVLQSGLLRRRPSRSMSWRRASASSTASTWRAGRRVRQHGLEAAVHVLAVIAVADLAIQRDELDAMLRHAPRRCVGPSRPPR